MTMHDIVICIIIAGGDECSRARLLRLALPIRPSDERPPVMYGHFCLVGWSRGCPFTAGTTVHFLHLVNNVVIIARTRAYFSSLTVTQVHKIHQ